MTHSSSLEPDGSDESSPPLVWYSLTPQLLVDHPDIAQKIDEFRALDHPAGKRAEAYLRGEALAGPTAKVHVLVGPERIEGFIATTFTEVVLERTDISGMGFFDQRTRVPAFYLAWVAKHRDTAVPGSDLVRAAYGLGLEAAALGGLVAFVLDPADDAVAELWMGDPYNFQQSKTKPGSDGVPKKLWTPLREVD